MDNVLCHNVHDDKALINKSMSEVKPRLEMENIPCKNNLLKAEHTDIKKSVSHTQ
jgi:hypothetical protein